MALSGNGLDEVAHGSLALLETRLHRLEFLLTGKSNLDGIPNAVAKPSSTDNTIIATLKTLRQDLDRLKRSDSEGAALIKHIISIYSSYPEIFTDRPGSDVQIPRSEDLSTTASIVLSHATLYPETASRLSSLQTLQIPPAEQSARLTELNPRIDKCTSKMEEMDKEIQALRERSARCLEWWVKMGVVGIGDLWEEWEDRLNEVERKITRIERRQKDED